MAAKLTAPQCAMLRNYDGIGVTTQVFGRIDTFSSLVRKGFLRRSYGLGPIEAEITDAGRTALSQHQGGTDGR